MMKCNMGEHLQLLRRFVCSASFGEVKQDFNGSRGINHNVGYSHQRSHKQISSDEAKFKYDQHLSLLTINEDLDSLEILRIFWVRFSVPLCSETVLVVFLGVFGVITVDRIPLCLSS